MKIPWMATPTWQPGQGGITTACDIAIRDQARYFNEMAAMFKLGVDCTVREPQERPSMREVLYRLRNLGRWFSLADACHVSTADVNSQVEYYWLWIVIQSWERATINLTCFVEASRMFQLSFVVILKVRHLVSQDLTFWTLVYISRCHAQKMITCFSISEIAFARTVSQ